MKESIRRKLEKLDERFEEIGRLLSEPEVIARQNQFRDLSMEYARLGPLVDRYRGFVALEGDAETARELAMDEELKELTPRLDAEELELQRLLVPKDPLDDSNIFLEVRAGTGGDEAALFAGDLFRMYARYAESKRWKVEILSESPGEHGGYKEIISRIIGRGRVFAAEVRVAAPIACSACRRPKRRGASTPPPSPWRSCPSSRRSRSIELNPADLRIDTYRSSGAGGQHVNKTDSADPHHAHADRHRGRVPGRALAAQESLARACRC